VGSATLVALPPATSVEAVLPPPVPRSTETAPPAEDSPLGVEGLALLEPDAPLDDSLTWAKRVELEEAKNSESSPVFQLHPVHPQFSGLHCGPVMWSWQ